MKILKGTVRWFNVRKGLGFIKPDDNDEYKRDIFVHYTGIKMEGFKLLKDNQRVEFAVIEDTSRNSRGPFADNVRVLDEQEEE